MLENADDLNIITYGMESKFDYYPENIVYHAGFPSFDVMKNGEKVCHIKLNVPGEHNILNSLATVTVCNLMGVDAETAAKGIETFKGTHRRFEKKGFLNGAVVIDNPPYYRGLPDHLRKRRKGKTSFVTSYSGGIVAQTAPDLTKAINRENDRLIKANTKELQKYDYPINVITAAMMQRYARYGVDLKIRADGCIQVGSLDAQKQAGKSIFGSGLLLCERAAAERAVVRWELSDREKAIIQQLG